MKDLFYLMLVLTMLPIIVVEWLVFLALIMDHIDKEKTDEMQCEKQS